MKTIEETRRELFEAWHAAYLLITPERVKSWREGDSYAANYSLTVNAWEAFNAALDAVCIELPGAFSNPDSDGSHAWNAYEREMRAAIESTNLGLRVK